MKERVREAVFNLVGPAIEGTLAIDLFAGTGALGLEALSRGAGKAIFVEQHFPTADAVRRNVAALGVEDLATVVGGDTFIWLRRFAEPGGTVLKDAVREGPPWAVFCSPPFDFYVDRHDEMLALVTKVVELAPAHSVLVVEADERFDFGELPRADQGDVRPYPPAVIGIAHL